MKEKRFKIWLIAASLMLGLLISVISPGAMRNVSADTQIKEVRINIPNPTSGNKPVTDTGIYYTDKDSHCTVTGVKWYVRSGSAYKPFSGTFGADGYLVVVTVKPDKGYTLPDDKKAYVQLIRGKKTAASSNARDIIDVGSGIKNISFNLLNGDSWKDIEIDIDEPKIGKTPEEMYFNISTAKGDGIKVVKQTRSNSFDKSFVESYSIRDTWYYSSDGVTYTKMSRGTTFKAGYYYKTDASKYLKNFLVNNFYKSNSWNYTGSTADAYAIDDNLKITVNDKTFSGLDDSKWEDNGRITFGPLKNSIENVRINNLDTPYPGSTPDTVVSSGESEKYSIENVEWFGPESAIIAMSSTKKYVAGEKYVLAFDVKAKGNYEFTLNSLVYFYINGEKISGSYKVTYSGLTRIHHVIEYVCPKPYVAETTLKVGGLRYPVEDAEPQTTGGLGVGGATDYRVDNYNYSWGKIYNDGTYIKPSGTWTFNAGTRYFVDIRLKASEGFSFPISFVQRKKYLVEVSCPNGMKAEEAYVISDNSDSDSVLTIRAEFKPLALIRELDLGGYVAPSPGEKASYKEIVSNNAICVVNKDNYPPYRQNGVTWGEYKGGTKKPVNYDDGLIFEENKAYYMEVYVKPGDGYAFPKVSEIPNINVIFSGNPKGDISVESADYGYVKITVASYVYPQISKINYSIPEPVPGKGPGIMTVDTTPNYAFTSDFQKMATKGYWEKSKDGKNYSKMGDDEVFEKGYYYRTNAQSAHGLLVFFGLLLGNDVFDNTRTSGLGSDLVTLINNKNSTEEGVLVDGYVVFDNLKPEDSKQEDPKNEDPKQEDPKKEDPKKEDPSKQNSEKDNPNNQNSTKTEPAKSNDSEVISKKGIAGKGTSVTAVEKVVLATSSEKELKGSEYGKLSARATKTTKKTITIKWNKVKGAKGYLVYGAKCGKYNYKKLAKVKSSKRSYVNKKLKKGTYYKYFIVAFDKNNKIISSSKIIHAATTGGKVGNAKTIKITNVKKNKKSIKKGKTFKLKVKQIAANKKLKIKNHRKISYESSNQKVAKVSKTGKIKAVGTGKCYIYVYAQNGLYAKVKLTVK